MKSKKNKNYDWKDIDELILYFNFLKMEDSNQEDIAISDNNSNAFQWALIFYALHPDRLFFIDNVKFWSDFHNSNRGNLEKCYELTPEELCECFMQQVLPEINHYDLSGMQQNLLSLLALHPGYRSTDDGFVKTQEMETIESSANNHHIEDVPEDSLLVNSSDANCQVLIAEHVSGGGQIANHLCQVAKENVAFLSAVLCSDADLPVCQLLDWADIHKRLREAKLLFEQSGQQLDNANCSIEDLVAKFKTLCELKETVAELVKKQF